MNDHEVTFDGYLAELIMLFAEKEGKSPQDYILSFFDLGCIAPRVSNGGK